MMETKLRNDLRASGFDLNEKGELVHVGGSNQMYIDNPQVVSLINASKKKEDKPLIGGFAKTLLILAILVGSYFFLGFFVVLIILAALLISHL